MKRTQAEQTEAKQALLKMLDPGDNIYTITRHVSRSGMQRRISAFVIKGGKLINLDWYIDKAGLFNRHHTEEGIIVGGCGMDMHFHVVHELGRFLYPDGFKLAKGQFGRNGSKSRHETDGGYAFNKESI